MAKPKANVKTDGPTPITDPKSAEDFTARGWHHYMKKEFFRAESDFRKALDLTPDHPDYLYGLALALQASGRSVDAIQVFEETIQALQKRPEEEAVRSHMLTRLARGHINHIKTGDWKLDAYGFIEH
jgi:Flp pilus assembly protein TadD